MTEQTFDTGISVVVEAKVEHHPPCVPECLVCHPPGGENA